jgi:hypothetical protein
MIKIINSIILLSIFFPYFVMLSPELHYTQPYPVMLGLVGIYINKNAILSHAKIRMPTCSTNYIIYLAVSLLFFILTAPLSTISVYRDLYGYFSLIVLSIVVYMIAVADIKLFIGVIKTSIILWAGVGCIQTYFVADFLNNFTGGRPIDHLISSGRGVTSLAPEPTHFGLIMSTFLLAGIFLKLPKLYFFVCIVSILLFSKSSTAVLFLIMVAGTMLIILKPVKVIPLLVSLLLICYLAGKTELINTFDWRLFKLSKSFISDPMMTLMSDESVRVRLNSMWLPIYASFTNSFIPYGFDPNIWSSQVCIMEDQFGNIVANLDKERIGAALPMMFFQTGIFIVIPMFPLIMRGFRNRNLYSILLLISLFCLGLQYVSPSFTMLGFLLGLIFYDLSMHKRPNRLQSQPIILRFRIFNKGFLRRSCG